MPRAADRGRPLTGAQAPIRGGVDAPTCLHCREAQWRADRRDENHTRSACPPHSYENISDIHECYESVKLSRQIV